MFQLKTKSWDLKSAINTLIDTHPVWHNRIQVDPVEGKWQWSVWVADPQTASALACILRAEADAVEFTDPMRPGRKDKLFVSGTTPSRGIRRHNFCRSARSFAQKLEDERGRRVAG
jgi:hypothetical protein